jgi:hypothetical protein
MNTDTTNLTAEAPPWTADQWAGRWQQEADARNELFRDYLAMKRERDDIERKLNEANDTLAVIRAFDGIAQAVAGTCPKHGTVALTGCAEWRCPACEEITELERKLAVCRIALGIRAHETIPDQKPTDGSLLVDEGSIRRRVYADGGDIAKITAERDDLRARLDELLAPPMPMIAP